MKIWDILTENTSKPGTINEDWKKNVLATIISVASLFGNVKSQKTDDNTVNITQKINNDSVRLDISKLFTSGKYLLNVNDNSTIKNELQKIANMMLKSPTSDFELEIVSSESQVPNYDMEKTSNTYKQRLDVGELAQKRAEVAKFILSNFVKELKNEGALKSNVTISEPKILIGNVKWPSIDQKTGEKRLNTDNVYSKDQYVYVNIKFVKPKNTSTYTNLDSNYGAYSTMGEPIYHNDRLFAMLFSPVRDSKDKMQSGNLVGGYQDILLKVVKPDTPLSGGINEKGVYLKSYLIPWQWMNKNVIHNKISSESIDYIFKHFEVKQ